MYDLNHWTKEYNFSKSMTQEFLNLAYLPLDSECKGAPSQLDLCEENWVSLLTDGDCVDRGCVKKVCGTARSGWGGCGGIGGGGERNETYWYPGWTGEIG